MAEPHARVPQRIPQRAGEVVDLACLSGALVDEHDVDVALWGQFAPTVPTDGDEGDSALASRDSGHGVGVQTTQPVVGDVREPAAQISAPERRVGDGVRPSLEHRGFHRGRLRPTLARCRETADAVSGWWSEPPSHFSW